MGIASVGPEFTRNAWKTKNPPAAGGFDSLVMPGGLTAMMTVSAAEAESEAKKRSSDADVHSAAMTETETHGGRRAIDGMRRDEDWRRCHIHRLLVEDRRGRLHEHGLSLVDDRLRLHIDRLGVVVLNDNRIDGCAGDRSITGRMSGDAAGQTGHRSETEDYECLFHILAVH